MENKIASLQDFIVQSINDIPDFEIKATYDKKIYTDKSEKFYSLSQLFDYHKRTFSNFQITYQYKSTCKLKFKCITCSKPGKPKYWVTSLGVCNIYFKMSLFKKSNIIDQKTKAQLNKEKSNRLQLKLLIMNLIYNIQAQWNAQCLQASYDEKQQLIKNIKFQYRFFNQKCKFCQQHGKPIYYPDELQRISINFARNIEKKLLHNRITFTYQSKYQLKEHLKAFCEACKLQQCPYSMYFYKSESTIQKIEKQKQQRRKDNPLFSEKLTEAQKNQYLANKYKKQLERILKQIKDKNNTIIQCKYNPQNTHPFSLIPNDICNKLKEQIGNKFFILLEIIQQKNQ